jgi:hypothetical protein
MGYHCARNRPVAALVAKLVADSRNLRSDSIQMDEWIMETEVHLESSDHDLWRVVKTVVYTESVYT